MNELLPFVGLFGSIQAVLLAIATSWGWRETGDRRQRYLLSTLFLVFALAVATIAVDHAGWLAGTVPLELLEYLLSLAAPPVFLAYARQVVNRELSGRWFSVHLGPAAIWLAWVTIARGIGAADYRPPILLVVLYQVAYTLRVAWLAFATATRRKYPAVPMLRAWVIAFGVVHLAQFARYAFHGVALLNDLVPITATVVLYALVLFALRTARVLQPPAPPYAASGLGPEEASAAAARITRVLEQHALYLDPGLDLDTLADRAALSRTHVSQSINQELGVSFHDLVGRYRVQAAIELLSDPDHDHLTIEAIGERAGFASRSSFYEAFRRHTGRTPGRFRSSRS